MKYLSVYYCYVKIPRYGCVKHRLEYIALYLQKYIEHLVACSGPPAGSRHAARGARICENRLYKECAAVNYMLC